MTDILSRAVVAVKATRLGGKDQDRTQSISDLFAWCGGGAITPNQLHAYLRPETSAHRPRAAALLICGPTGRHYLLSACHGLSDPALAGSIPQQSMEPDNSWSGGLSASGHEARPVYGMAEITFDEPSLPHHLRNGLFPARYLPHLDLSLAWLDETNAEICTALGQAGFAFAAADLIDDGPSAEGAEIRVIGSASLVRDDTQPPEEIVATGRVRGLSKALSFFWIDAELPPHFASAPVVEDERIVGFVSPQQVDGAKNLSLSFATIAKAVGLKALLAAREAAR